MASPPPPSAPAPTTREIDKGLLFAFSAIAALSYVLAIMAVAYPAHLVKKGRTPFSKKANMGFLVLHGFLLCGVGGFATLATRFGPLSMQLPLYQSSMMLWNIPIMWMLGMESFPKSQRTATIIVFWAAFALLDVGPQAETGPPTWDSPVTIVWFIVVTVLWILSFSCMILDWAKPHLFKNKYLLLMIYATVQGIGGPGTAAAGKVYVTDGMSTIERILGGVFQMAFAATDQLGATLGARKLNNAEFTPWMTGFVLSFNIGFDFLMWGGYSLITQWIGFIACNGIIVCGVYVMSDIDLFENAHGATSAFLRHAHRAAFEHIIQAKKQDGEMVEPWCEAPPTRDQLSFACALSWFICTHAAARSPERCRRLSDYCRRLSVADRVFEPSRGQTGGRGRRIFRL